MSYIVVSALQSMRRSPAKQASGEAKQTIGGEPRAIAAADSEAEIGQSTLEPSWIG